MSRSSYSVEIRSLRATEVRPRVEPFGLSTCGRTFVALHSLVAVLGTLAVLATACGTDEETRDAAPDELSGEVDGTQASDTQADADTRPADDATQDEDAATTDTAVADLGDASETEATQPDLATDVTWPSASWKKFVIGQGRGPCPPGAPPCTWRWELSPDGTIVGEVRGVAFTDQLSPADFTVVNGILEDPAFLALMTQGFTCGVPPSDIGVSFGFTPDLQTGTLQQTVTGCVTAEDLSGGYADTLYATITPYGGP